MMKLILVSLLISGCFNIEKIDTRNTGRSGSNIISSGGAGVYKDNPIILTGNEDLTAATFSGHLHADFITNENFLIYKPTLSQSIGSSLVEMNLSQVGFKVLNDSNVSTIPIQRTESTWSFNTGSDSFYQVNTFYHVKKVFDRVGSMLTIAHDLVHFQTGNNIPASAQYNFVTTKSYWPHSDGGIDTLTAYSKCYTNPMNAYYNAANRTLCYGVNEDYPGFLMVQDPTVIHHEVGHTFVDIMLNQRNITYDGLSGLTYTPYHASLGSLFYDEAGSINEGIADYFAFIFNTRKFIGEWGMQQFFEAGRPMSEDSSIHINTVSKADGERLSYPNYIYYDPNDLSKNYEDVHTAGQIVSHYLMALTEQVQSQCTPLTSANSTLASKEILDELYQATYSDMKSFVKNITHEKVKKHVYSNVIIMMLLNETLAEIGDLTARGSDLLDPKANLNPLLNAIYWTNLTPDSSYLWTQTVNPPNFRRFFQIFAKNIRYHLTQGVCPNISSDETEALLDQYGLLLFKDYKELGLSTDGTRKYSDYNAQNLSVFTGQTLSAPLAMSQVNELNRRYSVLVNKSMIDLPSDESIGFVFDTQSTIRNLLATLAFEGRPVAISSGLAGVEYNNNNIKISPGEVLGLAVNLKNNSNSAIAGIHVLANDWDHLKLTNNAQTYVENDMNLTYRNSQIAGFSPCQFDNKPLASEGGVTDAANIAGNCNSITKTNNALDLSELNGSDILSKYMLDAPQPVCLVQMSDNNQTRWATQNEFRKSMLALEDHNCLNNPSMSGDEFNPNECLIRFLPGADHAFMARADAQKTWAKTLQGQNNTQPSFNSSTALLMEVNKWISPGTTFNCRLRVNFNNCADCFNDPGTGIDYADYEFAGAKPYKVINFTFTVID